MTRCQGRRIVLVGGAGFIGHHLALTCARLGASVSVIDCLRVNNLLSFAGAGPQMSNRELYLRVLTERLDLLRGAGVRLYTQDARDLRSMRRLLQHIRPDVIVHLAGIAHADRSNQAPHAAFQNTLTTLENSLDAIRGDLEHFVFFSSSMVYGNFPSGRVTEETPCSPMGMYGALKYSGEHLVVAHHQVFGVPYTIVRPSALYGERCVSRRVVQVFIENALRGEPLTVDGDGTDRLDFTYIGDLVDGIIRVLTREESRNEVFNLTYGRSRSIEELLAALRCEFPDITVQTRPKNRLMPDRGTLCVDKARRMIGYEPQYPLERGVAQYVQWYRSLRQSSAAATMVEMPPTSAVPTLAVPS
jgi:nucleoside-diphosphate-sugar epimerase